MWVSRDKVVPAESEVDEWDGEALCWVGRGDGVLCVCRVRKATKVEVGMVGESASACCGDVIC